MKETLSKIHDLNEQVRIAKNDLATEFKTELKKIFVDHPALESVEMYVNNHEFNDGDTTYFEIGYEDLKIVVDGEEINRDDDETNPVIESLVHLFGEVQCIHEDLYGDEYEHLVLHRKKVLKY